MTKALVVIFHRYAGMVSDNDQILFEYWLKSAQDWAQNFDTLYIVNSNDYLPEGFDIALELDSFVHNTYPQIKVINTNNLSHAQNLNTIFPKIEEEIICIIDHDTLIYENTINVYLQQIEKFDVAAFIEKPDAKTISRFAPYFFVGKKSIFPANPDFSEEPPTHLDPFAKLTHQLLDSGITFVEVPDDRSTIQLLSDGSIVKNPTIPVMTGTYHVRNFMGGLILAETYQTDKDAFHRRFDTMPYEEVTRLISWVWRLNQLTRRNRGLEESILSMIGKEMNISPQQWDEYMMEFCAYHHYL